MTHITDMRGDLPAESCGWLFKSPLAGGGGILWRPHYRPHSQLVNHTAKPLFFIFGVLQFRKFSAKQSQRNKTSAWGLVLAVHHYRRHLLQKDYVTA